MSDKETAISEIVQEAVALSELAVPSPVRVSESDDEPPSTKKQCGLSKILEKCLGTSTATEADLSCQDKVESVTRIILQLT